MIDRFDAVVFDLGGVILDLAGLHRFLDRHAMDFGDFFARALGSGAHQTFERGDLDPDAYAEAFLAESGIDLDAGSFLADFATWPGDLLPGAAELAADVRAVTTTATLSNTNVVHWSSDFTTSVVRPMFDRHFPSYQLGVAKPDPDIFRRVVGDLAADPAHVVFLDDNQVNVDSARSVGLDAHRVEGPGQARSVLERLGVLQPSAQSANE